MASKPALDIFTGSKNLGRVFREQNQINVKHMEFNIWGTDTTGNTHLQIAGKTRIFVLQGAHDGTGFDGGTAELRLADFVYEMEAWVNPSGFPSIQATAVYTDSLGVSYNVYCVDWTWSRSFSDPSRVIWCLMMKQS